jgi:hypothetical protein
MGITRPDGPSGGMAVISRVLPTLLTRELTGAAIAGGAPPKIRATQPMQLFMLQADDISGPDFVKNARPAGWRYLIFDDGPIAVADVTSDAKLERPRFGSLIRGPMASRLAEAAELAAKHYEAAPAAYEARVLEIPSLYISALWLHGHRDVLFPFLEGTQSTVNEDERFTCGSLIWPASACVRPRPREPADRS